MDELINAIVLCIASMVIGAVFHSAGGHAGYNQRIRKWIEDNILRKYRYKYNCEKCCYKTDSHVEFQYHSCYLNAGEEGTKREK